MSLTFRRVTKISKKNRNSKSSSSKQEKDPTKPSINDTTYLENFPSLNSVYKSDIFGTPIRYHFSCGSDRNWDITYRVKCHVLVFMEEYKGKSVEELRWEDYQCNRKGRQLFEEKKYLKSLCFNRDEKDGSTLESGNVIPFFPDDSYNTVLRSKPPVQSTSAPKTETPPANPALTTIPTTPKEKDRSISPSRKEKVQIVRNNLLRFFAGAEPDASTPYESLPFNPEYYLPCGDVKFVRPRSCSPAPKDPLDIYEGLLEKKYTRDNRFCREYFWGKINPYARGEMGLGVCKAKNVLSGKYIVECTSS